MATVASVWRTSLGTLGREAVEFLYPPGCVWCGEPILSTRHFAEADTAARCWFCDGCRDLLRCRIEQTCLACGAPVGPHLQMWGCQHCRTDRFAFARVVTLGVYKDHLAVSCNRAKDASGSPLAAGLTELLWEAHQEFLTDAEIDVVIPVPHHWWDRATRRHLPPVTIGRVLARRLSIPLAGHILAKRRRTAAQTSLSPSRRRKNLRRAFRVAGGTKLDGRTVLMTDDILTTGTTADQAARVLKDAGAARILVAVLARGIGQSTGS